MNRREFLKAAACTGATIGFPSILKAASPNGKLCHACIGTGNMAWGDLNNFVTHKRTEIVALCDVDANYLEKAHTLVPGARLYRDWREMLAKEGDKIDSVNVSIPDHNHTIAAVTAMRLGKNVYCQKPLCHEVSELALLRKTAAETGVVTQLGVQVSVMLGERQCEEYLQKRVIGTIQHVYIFSLRLPPLTLTQFPPPPDPVPSSLQWELWLGTAPARSYVKDIYHPCQWRTWRDFGSGWIGDMGCHLFSAFIRGLGYQHTSPLNVIADVEADWKKNPAKRAQVWPRGTHITWTYPGNAFTDNKPLPVEWFDGYSGSPDTPKNLLPPPQLTELAKQLNFAKLPDQAKIIEGSDGWIVHLHMGGTMLVMKNGKAKPDKHDFPVIPTHYHEFLDACFDHHKTRANFDWTTYMMEAILCGSIAMRVPDTLLTWHPGTMSFGNPAADKLLRRSYRKGWELKGL